MFLPDPVPEDLTMPFGDFVVKYGIEAIVQTLYSTNQGTGDILSMPVLEQARVNGLSLVAQLAANGLISTASYTAKRRLNSSTPIACCCPLK